MNIQSTYKTRIKGYNRVFKDTAKTYREAVSFFIDIAIDKWDMFSDMNHSNDCICIMEGMTHSTKAHPNPVYDFDKEFPKFPSYLRRSAIKDAIGKVSSYKSNLENWNKSDKLTKMPRKPIAGTSFPCMYKDNMYVETGEYNARIKIYKDKQWVWLDVNLKKSDVDYIKRNCSDKVKLSPRLVRHGKIWSLSFTFEKKVDLYDINIKEQRILSVDLGINNACTCTVMTADGAVHGRYFLKLPVETDQLATAINRIKKAQQHGQMSTPRLWAIAKGINDDIAVKTVRFIVDTAASNNVDTIVFEYLDLKGKKKGSKRQRLHLWKAQAVQKMTAHKAHLLSMHVVHVCAYNTSRLAFDGSGKVMRGEFVQDGKTRYNYSICLFQNDKIYNCDLNAAYNIGARYFIRELLKSLPKTDRLALEAKDPSLAKRSTSTLSTLISLNADLKDLAS